jgi:transcriptional regulator with XRE-family HTH domain
MSVARFTFGPRLKAHRERQGITLQDIAESTKIGASLLSSLERNDVSQWPKGIYRRAFLRSYARAIDIPFEPVWAEFVQLFPEDGTAPTASRFAEVTQLRLTLASGTRSLWPPSTQNLVVAASELGVVLVVGLGIAWVTGVSAWMSLASTSLAYGAMSTALAGGSLVQWYLRTQRSRQPVVAQHDLALALDTDGPQAAASDEIVGATPPTPLPRPRIFAVPSTRAAGSSEARERRVADR